MGKLTLKWLDANGAAIKSATTSTAFIHLAPLSQTFAGVSSYGEGVVISGLGVGASVQVTLPIPMSFVTDEHSDLGVCLIGDFSNLNSPKPPTPLKTIPLSARPIVDMFFPDPFAN